MGVSNQFSYTPSGNAGTDAAAEVFANSAHGLSEVTIQQILNNREFLTTLGRLLMTRRDYDEQMATFKAANQKLIADQQELAQMQQHQTANQAQIRAQIRAEVETEIEPIIQQRIAQSTAESSRNIEMQLRAQLTQQLQQQLTQQIQQQFQQQYGTVIQTAQQLQPQLAQKDVQLANLVSILGKVKNIIVSEGLDSLADGLLELLESGEQLPVSGTKPTTGGTTNLPNALPPNVPNQNTKGQQSMYVNGQIYQFEGENYVFNAGQFYKMAGNGSPVPNAPSIPATMPLYNPPVFTPTPVHTPAAPSAPQSSTGGLTPAQQIELNAVMQTIASQHTDYQLRLSAITDPAKRVALPYLNMEQLVAQAMASGKTLVQQYEATYNIPAVKDALNNWQAHLQQLEIARQAAEREALIQAEVKKRLAEAGANGDTNPMGLTPTRGRQHQSPLVEGLMGNRSNGQNHFAPPQQPAQPQDSTQQGQQGQQVPQQPQQPQQQQQQQVFSPTSQQGGFIPPPIPVNPNKASNDRVAQAVAAWENGDFKGQVYETSR